MLSGIKAYYQAIIINTEECKCQHTDKWNRIENPKTNPHMHTQLIYGKGRRHYNGKKMVF